MHELVLLGLVIWFTVNIMTAWIDGGLRDAFLRRIGWVSDDLITREDVNRQLIASHGVVGAWLACPICSSGYFSLGIGAAMVLLFDLPLWFLLAAFLSPQYIIGKLFR